MKNKRETLIAWGLVILGSIVYISFIFNNNIWLDEGFSAHLVDTNMRGVIERSMADTLPPLYNILLKIMTDIFGYRIPVMKLLSVIPMILTMVLSSTVVRRRFSLITSCIFTLALIVMPNMIYYGVEIRMYSLGFFFATASGIYAYELICEPNKKNMILFVLFSVLAGYTHHFAFVTVGFVFLFLLLYFFFAKKEGLKLWVICLAATVILYFPCLLVTLKQIKSVSGYFSMPDVTLPVFIKYARYPYTVGCTPVTVLLALLIVLLIVFFCRKKNKNAEDIYALSMFAIYYGVLLFGTIISKIMTANIFVDRYLFFSLGLLWLFPSIVLGRFIEKTDDKNEGQEKRKSIMSGIVYASLAFEIIIGICTCVREYNIEYVKGCDELIAYLEANVNKGDVLYTDEINEELQWCLMVYDRDLEYCDSLADAIKLCAERDSSLYVAENVDMEGTYSLPGVELSEGYLFKFDRYEFFLYRAKKNLQDAP